jgi:hypothetical protein
VKEFVHHRNNEFLISIYHASNIIKFANWTGFTALFKSGDNFFIKKIKKPDYGRSLVLSHHIKPQKLPL